MEVTLHIEEEGSGWSAERSVDVADDAAVRDALDAAGVNPETVLVERDGRIVPADAALDGAQELRVLEVISGG
ncbi:MAG: MoaD/ThiS family protein [Candidatus Nanohaloarchaea archaeon]|nr:MoaD/ThiS family protein [Candidatus Nanohaloarchaea archaeon]